MSEHYSDGRRWSSISHSWILESGWNDREESASLRTVINARDAEIERLRKELADREKLIGDLMKRVKPIPADWPGEALTQQMLLISDVRRAAAFLAKGEVDGK